MERIDRLVKKLTKILDDEKINYVEFVLIIDILSKGKDKVFESFYKNLRK